MKLSRLFPLAIVGTFTASANAVLISGFEQTPDFWERENGDQLPALEYSNTVGVTQGAFSLRTKATEGFQLLIKTFDGTLSPILRQGGTLEVDVTIPLSGFTGTAQYFEVNAPTTGEVAPFVNHLVAIPNDGLTHTVTFQLEPVAPVQSFYGVFLGLNNGGLTAVPGGAEVYFDNIRFTPVPEPASMAVLGLGLAALKRRRKS